MSPSLGYDLHDDAVEDGDDDGEKGAVESPDKEVKHNEKETEYLPRRQIYSCHISLSWILPTMWIKNVLRILASSDNCEMR